MDQGFSAQALTKKTHPEGRPSIYRGAGGAKKSDCRMQQICNNYLLASRLRRGEGGGAAWGGPLDFAGERYNKCNGVPGYPQGAPYQDTDGPAKPCHGRGRACPCPGFSVDSPRHRIRQQSPLWSPAVSALAKNLLLKASLEPLQMAAALCTRALCLDVGQAWPCFSDIWR